MRLHNVTVMIFVLGMALPMAGHLVAQSRSGATFRVHATNPRCFLYQGRPLKILTSAEHYGAVVNADFDYGAYLDELARTGQNMTRVFAFYHETANGGPGDIHNVGAANTLAPNPTAAILPWLRVTGDGKALDGLNKFDLDTWNPAYFQRLRDFVSQCAQHDVICEVVFFSNPYRRQRYELFPSQMKNNINGVGTRINEPRLFMTLDDPTVVAFQERLIGKLVMELNDFDNLYYEICNEPNLTAGKQDTLENEERKVIAWQRHMAGIVREVEQQLPKRHLVAVNAHFRFEEEIDGGEPRMRNDDLAYLRDSNIDIVNYHYISSKADSEGMWFRYLGPPNGRAGQIWTFLRERDNFNKPVVFDETFSGVVRGNPERYAVNRAEAWEMLLSGGAGYNNLDWSFTPEDETGSGRAPIGDGRRLDGRPLRKWFQILRELLSEYDLAKLSRAPNVLPQQVPGYGYAASAEGESRYVFYFVDERLYKQEPLEARPLEVALQLPRGRYSVTLLKPTDGSRIALPPLDMASNNELSIPAFSEDVAVLLERGSVLVDVAP